MVANVNQHFKTAITYQSLQHTLCLYEWMVNGWPPPLNATQIRHKCTVFINAQVTKVTYGCFTSKLLSLCVRWAHTEWNTIAEHVSWCRAVQRWEVLFPQLPHEKTHTRCKSPTTYSLTHSWHCHTSGVIVSPCFSLPCTSASQNFTNKCYVTSVLKFWLSQ